MLFRSIKMELVDATIDTPIQAIAFGFAGFFAEIKRYHPIDICYTIVKNRHSGEAYTQLIIKDIKLSSQ